VWIASHPDVLMHERTGTKSNYPPLLAIGQQKKSALILCKAFHAEFAGPGAAIASPVEFGYTAVIAIGEPEITVVETYPERQSAYSRRIQWIRWLQKIAEHPEAGQRVEKLFSGFEAFFGSQILIDLPDEILALLAGVLPFTIATVRSQHYQLNRDDLSTSDTWIHPLLPITVLHPETLEILDDISALAAISTQLLEVA